MTRIRLIWLAAAVLLVAGCTEMRVEGDAKIFQSSATGSIIGVLIGLCLLVAGGLSVLGSFWPDRKPRNEYEAAEGGTPTSTRIGLAIFGFGIGFMGFFLMITSLLFSNKLHVTVYPDRVAMASTYNQSGGKEVVVPFDKMVSVELQEELNLVRKRTTYLVFKMKDGSVVKQIAGNNETRALDTIKQAATEFQARPVVAEQSKPKPAASPTRPESQLSSQPTSNSNNRNLSNEESAADMIVGTLQTTPAPTSTARPRPASPSAPPASAPTTARPIDPSAAAAPTSSSQYRLKRYPVTIPPPAGHSIVGPDTAVEIGRKLKACFANNWEPVTVVEVNNDGTITCNWDNWSGFTYKMLREDLAIGSGSGSGSAESSAAAPASAYTLKRYPITIPVAAGYTRVQADTEVKVGIKLGACYAGHWENVTVIAVNSDGTITCNWDNWRGFTYRMMREDLTIKK